jgi:isocitrate dehydrogenase (NAD+)
MTFVKDLKAHTITLIPGDGIGPEVTEAVVRMLEATGVKFVWESFLTGAEAYRHHGQHIPKELSDSIGRSRVALKGPVTTPIGDGFRSINVTLRQEFELYANVRPVKTLPGLPSRFPPVDIVLVRENTEGSYIGREREVEPGVVESIKLVTARASTRIAQFAFEYARVHNRKQIYAIHKANIMKMSDGLFLHCAQAVSQQFPDISYKEQLIDNACMQLVMNPDRYDMLLLENLYGDIMSDLCAAFVGGLGLVPSANIGKEIAIFEAVHGSAPDIAGKGIANPTALLQSAILMLRYLEEPQAAQGLQIAIDHVYTEGKSLTRDCDGAASTTTFTDAVIAAISR